MTTTTIETNYIDGEERTKEFHISTCEVPEAWAKLDNNDGAKLLVRTLLGFDGIPLEGTNGCLSFQGELDGVGYTMTFDHAEPDELGFVRLSNVRVYVNDAWKREQRNATTTVKYIVHTASYREFSKHTATFRKAQSAIERLDEARHFFHKAFENNGMCYSSGEPITEDELRKCLDLFFYVEKQTIES